MFGGRAKLSRRILGLMFSEKNFVSEGLDECGADDHTHFQLGGRAQWLNTQTNQDLEFLIFREISSRVLCAVLVRAA